MRPLDGRAAKLVDPAHRHKAHINLALPVPVGRWAPHGPEHLPLQKIRDGCPVSEDPDFIDRVLGPIERAGTKNADG